MSGVRNGGGGSDTTASVSLSAEALRVVVGEFDVNLQTIEKTFGVLLSARDGQIVIRGAAAAVERTARFLEELAPLVEQGVVVGNREIGDACRIAREDPGLPLSKHFTARGVGGGGRKKVFPRTTRQREYCEAVAAKDIVFAIGPAGTGKTYLAVALAVQALGSGEVRRLVLCRPAVEAGERIGFLPGDMIQKVDPFLRPLYDALFDLWDAERVKRLIEQGTVEVAPLAFMRGRTLNESFVIIDEAQNTTPQQMKMLLTRIGEGSKMVVNGDVTQIDLPAGQRSGLVHARQVVDGIEGFGFVEFDDKDVVRHELVQKIVKAYDAHEKQDRGSHGRGKRRRPDGSSRTGSQEKR